MKKLRMIITTLLVFSVTLMGCSNPLGNKESKVKGMSIDGPYTVKAVLQPNEDENVYYYVGAQYVDENGMAGIINSCDANMVETTISLVSKDNCTKVDIIDNTGVYSYYCEGNLLSEGNINMIQGNTIYAVFKNLLTEIVYEEEVAGDNGPYTHLISNLDNKARDLICEKSEEGVITGLHTTYPFNNYNFDIDYLSDPQLPSMDIDNSEKTGKDDLVAIINSMAEYMFNSTVVAPTAKPTPVEEEPEVVEEEPQEPESLPMTETVATLSDPKDLFVKISFSNYVDDVEFLAPTGGSYKVSSGNVEFMQDDNVTRDAYYRIPNAEMGTWQLIYDNANNDITFETVTDNKIRISAIKLSPVKDGFITVTPTLQMDKGLDINYEYHIDIQQDDVTRGYATNILNSKKDKANYNISVMDLQPGTYKIRLRLEYMYDGQHYINMYSSEDFTID